MPKLLHLIAACAENRVMGREGKLPWRIPEDFAQFSRKTAGNVCVMGRICFATWPAATREGRQPIVLTSRPLAPAKDDHSANRDRTEARVDGQTVPVAARSLNEALAVAQTIPGEIFVCGGERIFTEALALRRPMRLHLTLVHADVAGDRYFPEWRHLTWREIERHDSSDANYAYTFFTLERVL